MALSHITITDLGQDGQGKCNDLMDATQVSANMITGNILQVTRFDSSTYQIQLPYSQDQINVGLVTSITGVGPYSTNTTSGSYQISGVIYSIGAPTNFPIPAAPIAPDNRIDLIYGDTSSTLFYVAGTPLPSPTPPAVPANSVAIAYIFVGNAGAPYIYDLTDIPITAGTTLNSTLRQSGSAQVENTKLRHTTSLLINEDSDISSSQDNGINAYELSATKTLTNINQFRYSDNNTAGLLLQNCEFNLSSIENGVDRLSEVKTFGTSGILTIRNEDTTTSDEAIIQLNGTAKNALIGIGGGSQSTQGEFYRQDTLGVGIQTVTVSSNYNITTSDQVVLVNTSGGSYSVVLPVATVGRIFTIKDVSGNAFGNPIVITASGGLTIDGSASVRINYPYGGLTLIRNNSNQSVIESFNKSSQSTTGSYGHLSFVNNSASTAVAVNTQTVPNTVLVGATTNSILSNVNAPTNGRLQYTTPAPSRFFEFTLSASLSVGVNNQTLGIALAKNGVVITNSMGEAFIGNSNNLTNINSSQIDQANPSDYYEIFIRNATSANAITVKHFNLKMIELQRP